ncbi:hypothetical protein MTY66_41750 [Mycolicibacterium sp. TY66]|nr:hypothetical protein MTY66_41750 [Mycolicibacterium sp. TY66]
MAISVQMPALGESVTEGTVTRWLKQEGDTVAVDEPLLEVSTDKVDTEIPSPAAGVLTKIVAQEDDVVEIGGELAVIGEAGESPAPSAPEPAAAPEPEPTPAPEPAAEAPAPAAETPAPAPASAPAPAASDATDATSIVMPTLGESVTEGTVTRWLKKVGDSVEVDEPLVEVSTDKVDTEIPSPIAGVLLSITADEDDVVSIGGELAKIGAAGSAPAAAPAPEAPAPAPAPEPAAAPTPPPAPPAPAAPTPPPPPRARSRPGRSGARRSGCCGPGRVVVGRRQPVRHPAGAKVGCREQR